MHASESLPVLSRPPSGGLSPRIGKHGISGTVGKSSEEGLVLPSVVQRPSSSGASKTQMNYGGEQSISWSQEGTRVVGTAKKYLRRSMEAPKEGEENASGLPANWARQRLISEGVEKSKVGWENEIARHILSVYATTNAIKNAQESEALLDFVGDKTGKKKKKKKVKRQTGRSKYASAEDSDDEGLMYAVPQFRTVNLIASGKDDVYKPGNEDGKHGHTRHHKRLIHSYDVDDDQGVDGEEVDVVKAVGNRTPFAANSLDQEDLQDTPGLQRSSSVSDNRRNEGNDASGTSATDHKSKKKTKNTRRSSQESATASTATTTTTPSAATVDARKKPMMTKAEQDAQNERYINDLLQKIAAHTQSGFTPGHTMPNAATTGGDGTTPLSSTPYRTTNTIMTRTGQVITVRGLPRVNPIWFGATAAIYCDWSALPGGRKLAAHLSVLYETGNYEDYVQILRMLIIKLYRRNVFGAESFNAGTFGLSETYADALGNSSFNTTAPSRRHGNRRNHNSHRQQHGSNDKDRSFHMTFAPPDIYGNNSLQQQPGDAWYDPLLRAHLSSPVRQQARNRYHAETTPSDAGGQRHIASSYQPQAEDYPSSSYATSPHRMNATATDTTTAGKTMSLRASRLYTEGDPDYAQADADATPHLHLSQLRRLWEQLLLTTLALGTLCCEQGREDPSAASKEVCIVD